MLSESFKQKVKAIVKDDTTCETLYYLMESEFMMIKIDDQLKNTRENINQIDNHLEKK